MIRFDLLRGRTKPFAAIALLAVALLSLASVAALPPAVQARTAAVQDSPAAGSVRPPGAAAQVPTGGVTQTPTSTTMPGVTSTVASTETATLAATTTSTSTTAPTATASAGATSTATATSGTTLTPMSTVVLSATTTATQSTASTPTATATQAAPSTLAATATIVAMAAPAIGVAPVPPGTTLQVFMPNPDPQFQNYSTVPNAYADQWYAQRHLSNPALYQSFAYEPMGECGTYYYQYQGLYYCYTGGVGGQGPGATILVPGTGGVQTPTGYALASYWANWANVEPQYQYFNGPNNTYADQWYAERHLSNPALYQSFAYEPVTQCSTYYYQYRDRYFCYTGGNLGGQAPGGTLPLPTAGGVQTATGYALASYWANVDSQYQYYNGPSNAYEDQWYAQRHINNPLLYRSFSYEPAAECSTYYYQYQDSYYCFTGLSTYDAGDAQWVVPIRYWAMVDPQYQYYYGPDYVYDDAWYAQRQLRSPDLYQSYNYAPSAECSTYYYQYQGLYYCYTGS